MARPKKPEDPDRYPDPCARCHGHHPTAAIWAEGRVCGYCYRAAMRVTGTCACGHTGILPGLVDGAPACRGCSGLRLNIDCRRCGAEAELYRDHLCQRCVLADLVHDALADPRTGAVAPELVPVADGLKAMQRANSGLTWIRQAHVQEFLHGLATSRVTHDAVDGLPGGATREHVRGLLVEYGALPRRDEILIRFESWARAARDRVDDATHRDVVDRYVRWHHLRRMREQSPVPHGTFLRAKQSTTVAIDFLNWLTGHDTTLTEATQSHVDAWVATGPTTRLVVARFIAWARRAKLVPSSLTVHPHRRGTAARMGRDAQDDVIDTVVHEGLGAPRDRLAAVLVLVFGQTIERVANLTWDDITIADTVTLTLAEVPVTLEPPLDRLALEVAAHPAGARTAGHPCSNWVFPGGRPGTHVTSSHLRHRLKPLLSALPARLGTLSDLTSTAPIAVLAQITGYAPATLEQHAVAAAVDYQRYAGRPR